MFPCRAYKHSIRRTSLSSLASQTHPFAQTDAPTHSPLTDRCTHSLPTYRPMHPLTPHSHSQTDAPTHSSLTDTSLPTHRPMHRLDAATGGLLVCAKTRLAQTNLAKAFEKRQVTHPLGARSSYTQWLSPSPLGVVVPNHSPPYPLGVRANQRPTTRPLALTLRFL